MKKYCSHTKNMSDTVVILATFTSFLFSIVYVRSSNCVFVCALIWGQEEDSGICTAGCPGKSRPC